MTAIGAAVAVTAAALDDGWTALMPVGPMEFLDGRKYALDNPAAVIAASPTERALVDFDHGADVPGGRSEAAGWIEEFSLERIPGFIAARVSWTESGRRALADRLYRFISPSFRHDAKRRVVQIVRAGLTNRPAIAELPALANATKGDTMTTATDPLAAAEAAAALKIKLAEASEACVLATAERDTALAAATAATARVGELETALAAAQAQAGALEARAAELAATIDALHAEADAKERAGMIATAAREGRVVPAMMKFLDSLSREQLTAYLAAAPVIVTAAAAALPAHAAAETLTPMQQKITATLGISREAFLAAKPAPETV